MKANRSTLESISYYDQSLEYDRLLIAQAIAEDIVIVSVDSAFSPYPAKRVWE